MNFEDLLQLTMDKNISLKMKLHEFYEIRAENGKINENQYIKISDALKIDVDKYKLKKEHKKKLCRHDICDILYNARMKKIDYNILKDIEQYIDNNNMVIKNDIKFFIDKCNLNDDNKHDCHVCRSPIYKYSYISKLSCGHGNNYHHFCLLICYILGSEQTCFDCMKYIDKNQ